MAENKQIFIDFFPQPPDLNPFMFKSKEDYFKAENARDELRLAWGEWLDIPPKTNEITQAQIERWRQLYVNYKEAVNEGLQDCYKQESV